MAAEFELYHHPVSQPSRSVLLTLKVTNAPHKVNIVNFEKGDHMKPEFLKLNPFHKVPVLVHGDFVLTESPAIVKYVLSNIEFDDHWYPSDLKKRARVDEYISYQHTTVREIHFVMNFILKPMLTGQPISEERKQEIVNNFHDVWQGFEGYFLKDRQFIAGEEVSIADIFAVSEILQSRISGRDVLSAHPNLVAWIERTKAATQPQFDEVFKGLHEFVKARNIPTYP